MRHQNRYIAFNPGLGFNIASNQIGLGASGRMKTRLLTIISIGITIGFLLGMGVVAMLRAALVGDTPELEIAFTLMVVMMGGSLVVYVFKTAR